MGSHAVNASNWGIEGSRWRAAWSLALTGALAGLLAILGVGLAPAPAHAAVQTVTIDGITYTADDENPAAGATVTTYDAAHGTNVAIPNTVEIGGEDYAVTTIGDEAFHSKGLTSVSLPGTLTSIKFGAFWDNQLTSVDLPEGLRTIARAAFGTNHLGSLTLPSTLTSIGLGSFADNRIGSLVIPPSLTTIAENSFAANRITSLTLHDGITSIEQLAFAYNRLSGVNIPSGITEIAPGAFLNNMLVSVTIPGNVKKVGKAAFSQNPSLTSVTILDGVDEIDDTAFGESYAESVFYPCNISSLDLGHTVTDIGTIAFQGCKLTRLTIPDSMELIDVSAFQRNPLISLDLGDGVEVLYAFAFAGTDLTEVTIPASLTFLGDLTFHDSVSLTNVRFLGAVPENRGNPLILGSGATDPSIEYYWRYGESAGVSGGFTTPLWLGKYPSTVRVIVDFDMHGHGDEYQGQDFIAGDVALRPENPRETGWTFDGWYADSAYTTPFDFSSAITQDTIVHAKWTQVTHEVTFDLGGHGDAIAPAIVDYGDPLLEPTPPSDTGWTFTGWFTGPDFSTPYDFDAPVSGQLTLYAGWTIESYSVDFDSGAGSPVPGVTVEYGGFVPRPTEDPNRTGYTFTGWFSDAALTTLYDFHAPISGPVTLHAGWVPVPVTGDPADDPANDPADGSDNRTGANQPSTEELGATGGESSALPLSIALLAVAGGWILVTRREPRGRHAFR